MGFKFTFLCDLLSSLENNKIVKASTEASRTNPDVQVVNRWFIQHGKRIRGPETDRLALLSCMFPEKRTDRVYWLQDISLARVIGRCLLLGSSRREELERWRVSGGIDLGQCVENVMRQAENHTIPGQEVTVEEVDAALNSIASRCRFSGPRVRRQRAAVDVDGALSPLYRRLSSKDAKWLTRMILKALHPIILPVNVILKCFHFLLPHLLLFQDSFEAALAMLASEPIRHFPSHPEPGLAKDLGVIALQHLDPQIGVKIGRPEYYKARSIKHCCQLIGRRRISMERKYDGEYCQIHIDLTTSPVSIQIFSKNGKDSTVDRSGIHNVLKDTLKLGQPGCKFSRRCILEGELLVYSDEHDRIMDFHKLRTFISRSGVFIGTENDSPPQPYEHLMIVFFDILLLDDDICLRIPHRERRLLLKDVVQSIHGRAGISEQRVLDFSHSESPSRLESIFAKGVADRWEGFVIKACDDPYFTFFSHHANTSSGRWIKLKKDYIPGLGDTMDLALVGGAYDSRDAASLSQVGKLSWTHFFIGCLTNKDAIVQSNARPRFRMVDVINRHCMSTQNLQLLNKFGEFSACSLGSGHGFDIDHDSKRLPQIDVIFKKPFVVEMLGSGFERPSGARFYTLRFPRIVKIHCDRSFEDSVSFKELQLLAEDARSVPQDDLGLEEHEWSKRLKVGNGSSQYIRSRSRSVLSTASSSQCTSNAADVELSTGAASNSGAQEAHVSQTSSESSRVKKNAPRGGIPIYVDQMAASMLSGETKLGSDPLATNDNLSRRGSYQKTLSSSNGNTSYERHDSPKTQRKRAIMKDDTSQSASLPSESRIRHEAQTSTTTLLPSSTELKEDHQSALCTIPVYYTHGTIPHSASSKFNVAIDTKSFLAQLHIQSGKTHSEPSDKTRVPRNISYGLVITDTKQTPLGPTLLNLTKSISQELQAEPCRYPSHAKVFVLAKDFLELCTDPSDTRFCQRETWEYIGVQSFYASLSWGAGRSDSAQLSSGEVEGPPASSSISEIPPTPANESCQGGGARDAREGGLPRIKIAFDRRELHVLGEVELAMNET